MAEKTTVAFRVDETVKQEWEEATEGPEYNSLSHLIRLAVQREITETEAGETDTQAGVEADGEVLESLNRLEKTVEEIHEEMGAVGRESRADELYDLEQVVLEILPSYDPSIQDLQNPTDTEIESLSPEEVAARIGADEEDVSDALRHLSNNTGQVRKIESGLTSAGDKPGYVGVE